VKSLLGFQRTFLTQAPADPLFTVEDLSNYTALAPGPRDATSHTLLVPPLTTNASEAEAWYRRLAPKDADGRTVIVAGIYRFYASNIAAIGPSVIGILLEVRAEPAAWPHCQVPGLFQGTAACSAEARSHQWHRCLPPRFKLSRSNRVQGLGSVLDAVQLSFHAPYAVLQQPPGDSLGTPPPQTATAASMPPADALLADGVADTRQTSLAAYRSMDLYFSMARKRQRLHLCLQTLHA
jgi:hypothetical protein